MIRKTIESFTDNKTPKQFNILFHIVKNIGDNHKQRMTVVFKIMKPLINDEIHDLNIVEK